MPVLPHQQNRAIRKNRKQHDGATMGDDVPRDFDAARLDDAILPHAEHFAFIKDVAVENFCSSSRHGQRFLAQDRLDRRDLALELLARDGNPGRIADSTECKGEMPDGRGQLC